VKRFAIAALAFAVVLVGAAPGLSSASSTKAPKLTNMLLTIRQMPIGWTVASSSGSHGIGCLHDVFEPRGTPQTGHAEVTFTGSGGLPEVEEVLATYSVPPKTAFSRIVGPLDGCKHVAGTLGRAKWTGTVARVSFPQLGNQSAAFYVTLRTKGTSLGQYALVVRQGAVLLGLSDGSVGKPRLSQFEQFAKLAVTKLGR
jgi:hypothetical protein